MVKNDCMTIINCFIVTSTLFKNNFIFNNYHKYTILVVNHTAPRLNELHKLRETND